MRQRKIWRRNTLGGKPRTQYELVCLSSAARLRAILSFYCPFGFFSLLQRGRLGRRQSRPSVYYCAACIRACASLYLCLGAITFLLNNKHVYARHTYLHPCRGPYTRTCVCGCIHMTAGTRARGAASGGGLGRLALLGLSAAAAICPLVIAFGRSLTLWMVLISPFPRACVAVCDSSRAHRAVLPSGQKRAGIFMAYICAILLSVANCFFYTSHSFFNVKID